MELYKNALEAVTKAKTANDIKLCLKNFYQSMIDNEQNNSEEVLSLKKQVEEDRKEISSLKQKVAMLTEEKQDLEKQAEVISQRTIYCDPQTCHFVQ